MANQNGAGNGGGASDHDLHPELGIPWQKMPRHIAIIMDGNGRWAQERGLPRLEGHANGSKNVRWTITECARLGVECLTLYSFSTENWKRPQHEIEGLMDLYAHYLVEERKTIMDNNIRVRHIGTEQDLPERVLVQLHETIRLSSGNTGMTLCLAINYSGRSELVRGIQRLAGEVKAGRLAVEAIDEQQVSDSLDTHGLPDPDLLIRTAGDLRISNFLLWQISYAEMVIIDEHWPDFSRELLKESILSYSRRNRRFGGLNPENR